MIASMNKYQKIVVIATALLLLVPFVAMKFTSQVSWSLSDFLVAGVLLLIFGFTFEWLYRKLVSVKFRWIILAALFVVFVLIWAELAVGVFGTPFAGS
jgi:hypothetical protein